MAGLNEKQKRFCEEYMLDLNGWQAALRAGYSRDMAKKLMARPLVNDYIKELREQQQQRTLVTADRVIQELAAIGFADMGAYVRFGQERMELNDLSTLSPEQRAAIASVTEVHTRMGPNRSFKLHDKVRCLELLGRHLGIFEKDNNQSNQVIARQIILLPAEKRDEERGA